MNCGLPISGINQAYSNTGTVGAQDCDITISLDNQAAPVDSYRRILRAGLAERFPGTDFSFLPGDITAKILNFGLPSPIDIQVSGRDLDANFAYATKLAARLKQIAGIADVRIQQVMGQPTLLLASRRTFALGTGLTEADIADNALTTLSGSGQVAPTYWLDTSNGISHLVNVQTPQNQLASINDLETIPVDKGNGNPSQRPATDRRWPVANPADRHAGSGFALRDHAGDRHLCQRGGARSWRGQRRGRADRQGHGSEPAARRDRRRPAANRQPCTPPTPSCSPAWPCRSC